MSVSGPERARRGVLQPILSRPNLLAGAGLGLAFYVLATPWIQRSVTRGLVGWDIGVALFIVLSLMLMRDCDYARVRARAIAHDEGRHFMLALALVAAGASVVAILVELGGAKGGDKLHEAIGVGLTAGTIVLSWLFVQVVFAIHYAHMFYLAEVADGGEHKGGLLFPGNEEPDYWDFLHFSIVIGATSQTADISIASKEFRRVGTIHCLIAFAFNTTILATMINLAAGLF
ncbi:MAG TPA: DUF1345 domain-containing protein [Caulobacteraceae bacterium]|jgi:uncharacterized membrane protein|nr:DUF1345 domain-containing protein [Caulobacteraceae bacterium]